MVDLIDRQKIKAKFESWLKVKGYSEGELNMLKAVLFEISVMPSADVQSVRHGKWIDGKRMGYDGVFVWYRECSECGYERNDDNIDNDTPYCPQCGTKMDEVT